MFAGFLFNSVRLFEFQTSDKFTLVECNNGRYGVKFSFGMFDSKMTIKNRSQYFTSGYSKIPEVVSPTINE